MEHETTFDLGLIQLEEREQDDDVTGKQLPSTFERLRGGWSAVHYSALELRFRMWRWEEFERILARTVFSLYTVLVWCFIIAGNPFTGEPIISWSHLNDFESQWSSAWWHWLLVAILMIIMAVTFYQKPCMLTWVAFGVPSYSEVKSGQAIRCLRWNFGYQLVGAVGLHFVPWAIGLYLCLCTLDQSFAKSSYGESSLNQMQTILAGMLWVVVDVLFTVRCAIALLVFFRDWHSSWCLL